MDTTKYRIIKDIAVRWIDNTCILQVEFTSGRIAGIELHTHITPELLVEKFRRMADQCENLLDEILKVKEG